MQIPLFPLRTVLFPGMELPLRIFEPRYKAMLRDVLKSGGSFGVVLIREGHEAGGEATTYRAGTIARINDIQQLANGQILVSTVGDKRFHIEERLPSQPYPRGRVRQLEDTGSDNSALLRAGLERVRATFPEYFRLSLALTDQWARGVAIPSSPHELVDFIGPWLQTEEEVKQQLLEDEDASGRIMALAGVLDELVERVREQVRQHHLRRQGGLGAAN